jgi:sugar phosphate isomerase/epimerase
MDIRRTVLWSATLGPRPLGERVAAAAASGYPVLSVSPADEAQLAALGSRPGEARRRARDQGVELSILDGITEWYPHPPPKRPFPGAAFSVDDILRIGVAFDVASISALAPFPSDIGVDDLAGHFAALCDRAAEHGIRIHLEFTPVPPVPDLTTAWEVVSLAGRASGGIVFDTWHFYRGNPDFGVLASVPGERIMAVQVSDGKPEFRESLIKDTFRHRLLPGDGSFDLSRVLRALGAIGGLNQVGPEVLSEDLFALPAADAARRAAQSFDRLVAGMSGPAAPVGGTSPGTGLA